MNEKPETTPARAAAGGRTERTEPTSTVGDLMQEGTREAVKKFVLFLSVLVYLGGLTYAEVHGWNVLSKGINPDMQIWAGLGMIALGITAIALPLALHSWTFEPMQRFAAFAFYGIDIALLGVNAFTDFNVNTGQVLAPWARNYLTYVLPTTPVIAAIGWSILWILDPSSRALVIRQTLRESIIKAKANQIATAAKSTHVSAAVQAAAEREVSDALTDLFGKPVTVNDDDDGWPIWRDGYEQGKKYQQTTDTPKLQEKELAHPENIIWNRGNNPANYYDPSSEYALPCGHTAGETWSKTRKVHECNVCGAVRDEELKALAKDQEAKPDQGGPFPNDAD